MTAEEIAKRVGKNRAWVYAHAKDGLIPALRTGSGRAQRWLFPRLRVERFIANLLGESRNGDNEQMSA
jgi:excisionase family DNA binding protein